MPFRSAIGIALLVSAVAAWLVSRPDDGPTARNPVVVAGEPIPASAMRFAQFGQRRSTAGAADLATEHAWLSAEVRGQALRAAPSLHALRARVADGIGATARDGRAFVAAFDAWHERWRARTRCLPSHADPVMDRCANLRPAAEGGCRWMGDSWLCRAGRSRLVVVETPGARRAARRIQARLPWTRGHVEARKRSYTVALRSPRLAARTALALHRNARRARALAARRRDPALSAPTLTRLAPVCRRYGEAVAPYRFAPGLQDPRGAADGILGARLPARRALSGVGDAVDRAKLRRLVRAMEATDRLLVTMRRAARSGDGQAAASVAQRLTGRARLEARLGKGLRLGDCLAVPAA